MLMTFVDRCRITLSCLKTDEYIYIGDLFNYSCVTAETTGLPADDVVISYADGDIRTPSFTRQIFDVKCSRKTWSCFRALNHATRTAAISATTNVLEWIELFDSERYTGSRIRAPRCRRFNRAFFSNLYHAIVLETRLIRELMKNQQTRTLYI